MNGSGTRLVLAKAADDLTQRDFDTFFAAYQRYPQGDLKVEDEGKKVRAAFDAHWITELVLPSGPVANAREVDDIHPQKWVRWTAAQIDAVIVQAREVPKASSSESQTSQSENG